MGGEVTCCVLVEERPGRWEGGRGLVRSSGHETGGGSLNTSFDC